MSSDYHRFVVLVTGFHRSGTSVCAGVVHHLGIPMGEEFLPPTLENAKGNFEDVVFGQLCNRAVPNFRNFEDRDHGIFRAGFREIALHRNRKYDRWGVKSPRLMPFLPDCLKILRCHVKVIFTRRGKEESTASLDACFGVVTLENCRSIYRDWYGVQDRVLSEGEIFQGRHADRSLDYCFREYSQAIDDPRGYVERLATFLGVEPTSKAVEFIDQSLRHWRPISGTED